MTKKDAESALAWVAEEVGDATRPELSLQRILGRLLSMAVNSISSEVAALCGLEVQTGPFAGMKYFRSSAGSALAPKLLGCYEAELHPVIADIRRRGYRKLLNLGCGEGYYAVGLARIMPDLQVEAFDTDTSARAMCQRLAELNGVENRVRVNGRCEPQDLATRIGPETLVFCDIEGGELELLDPTIIGPLASCDLVVELHDFINPAISTQVCGRFAGTHEIHLVGQQGRNPFEIPAIAAAGQFEQFLAMNEGRPGPTPWAVMIARTPPESP